MIRALLIKTDKTFEVVEIEGTLAEFYRLVECETVQAIYGYDWGGPDWTAFIDDEGKYADPPKDQNVVGELMARNCGWGGDPRDFIVGNMLFVGPTDEEGNETSVPQELIDLAPRAHDRAIELLNRAGN